MLPIIWSATLPTDPLLILCSHYARVLSSEVLFATPLTLDIQNVFLSTPAKHLGIPTATPPNALRHSGHLPAKQPRICLLMFNLVAMVSVTKGTSIEH